LFAGVDTLSDFGGSFADDAADGGKNFCVGKIEGGLFGLRLGGEKSGLAPDKLSAANRQGARSILIGFVGFALRLQQPGFALINGALGSQSGGLRGVYRCGLCFCSGDNGVELLA
jgi:hypothetical protein